ncbi:hypothetical protein HPB48_014294 [Haemaphysalis longicornis]|uniref:BRCT domain-containing protein n=1 Tax=Haemaphysalis longicornis TaxID=44386 RepID=A0A9J6FLN7_HAELO|nr:hypothetical protein HPB48_014294 [Haemaphysalis longicornis]
MTNYFQGGSNSEALFFFALPQYLAEMPTRCNGWPTIIVSCKEDLKSCMESTERHVPIVSAEFVLSGLLQYKVDFGAHTLD